jgi:hypothetical protein
MNEKSKVQEVDKEEEIYNQIIEALSSDNTHEIEDTLYLGETISMHKNTPLNLRKI